MTSLEFNGDKQAYAQAILDTCPPRYAELNDVDRLVEFDRTVFAEEGSPMGPRYLTNHIDDNPTGIEVLEIDGQIAACIVGDMYRSHIQEGRCYGDIASLAVAAEYRGRGLGELMLRRMMGVMLTENPTGIMLHTRVSNLAMQGLATKQGFKIEDREPEYYIRSLVPEDAFLMIYRPDPPS